MSIACPTSHLHDYAHGGIRRDRSEDGPRAYAAQLARYISDASTIRARVMEFYGRAPTLRQIEELQHIETAPVREYRRVSDMLGVPEGDPDDFRVRPIQMKQREIAALPKAKPVVHFREPEPRRVRDQTKHLDAPELPAPANGPVTWHEIVCAVAQAYRVTAADIIGPSRAKPVVIPRRVCIYILHKRGRASLPQIGKWLGGRNHSTVMHNIRMFEDCADDDMRRVAARFLGDGE